MAGHFIHDESGATAIEYGLIVALIAVAAIASFTLLGDSLINLMGVGTGGAAETINNQLDKLN
jgi:pilus assembly protein Flp/PilA